MDASNPVSLAAAAKQLVDGKNYATFATVGPDGQPQLSVVWITRDGDDLLISTIESRQKFRNLSNNDRASVVVLDAANPYNFVEVRGRVTMTREGGPELIDALNEKYTGTSPYTMDAPENVRVVVRLTPEHVVTH